MTQIDIPLISLLIFIGACIGSFINVLSLRYGKQPPTGRSFCPRCHRSLTAWDLIPILSFTFLRGRCRSCQQNISVQYPMVELALAIIALIIFLPFPATDILLGLALLKFIIASLLVTLFLIDLRTMFLPDIYIILLSITIIIHQFQFSNFNFLISNFYFLLSGLLIGAGFLAFLWLITKGKGIGLGDVKLMLPLGFFFGPQATIILLFIAFVSGGALASILLITNKANLKTPVPFGPFLCAAAIILLILPELPQYFLSRLLLYN